jgi:hypothetical protein
MRSFSGLSTKAYFAWPASASTMLQRPRRVAGQKKVLTGFLQKPRGVYRYPSGSFETNPTIPNSPSVGYSYAGLFMVWPFTKL